MGVSAVVGVCGLQDNLWGSVFFCQYVDLWIELRFEIVGLGVITKVHSFGFIFILHVSCPVLLFLF